MKVFIAFLAVLFLVESSQAAELKVATVDLRKLLVDYHRSQEVARQLKEKEVSFTKELESLRLEGRKLSTEVADLAESASLLALSATERDARKKLHQVKLTDLNTLQVRYDDLRSQRESELQMQAVQANKKILAEVMTVTRRVGESAGVNLILNANQIEPAAGPVLFSKNVDDLTDRILAILNAEARQPLPPK